MPLNNITQDMLAMLPSWMKMREENSTGANLLGTVGTQLEDIESLISNLLTAGLGELGDEANLMSIDYLYKLHITEGVTDQLSLTITATKDGAAHTLRRVDTVYSFYTPGVDKFFFDTSEYIIYFREKFDSVTINDAEFTDLQLHHVWGPLDELGLLLACPRLPGERNVEYQARLMDVFQNPGNSSKEGLQNYLSRSLGIDKSQVIIESMYDDNFIQSLTNEDGSIKDELKEYISISNKVNQFGINTYWEILDEAKVGLKYLPIVWDLGLDAWNIRQMQNGVGDTDDLEVIAPKQEVGTQEFDYNIYAEGLYYPDKRIYPEHTLKYKVYATGQKYDDGYKPETYKYTVTAAEAVPLTFDIVAHEIYRQEANVDFSGAVATAAEVTALDRKPDKYIVGGTSIKDGSYSTNPAMRFVQVAANLSSSNPTQTPQVSQIDIEYRQSGVDKKIRIKGQSNVYTDVDGVPVVGFETNTWGEASPLARVKNDTNDSYNAEVVDNKLVLAKGQYQKIYNSQGDWDDGISNAGTINVFPTSTGSLKLTLFKEIN